ncbi:hyperosmotically inducible protein [Janthinobacterium sp. CG_S6]|nr:hyperosmotically inducible protein [Janthinobacterium sp. CG_S6]
MRHAATFIGLSLVLSCGAALATDQSSAPKATMPAAHGQASPVADNTLLNARDKTAATATPQAQSNAESDRKLLAAVRRTVVDDKSLSTSAHNVKILVANGVVTLRGPVNSDTEKSKIEALAKQVAGVSSVNNSLDIKTH